jgi:hypothetical protein
LQAIENMLRFIDDDANTDADGDGVADTDEGDDNEDLMPDELPLAVRAAYLAVGKFPGVPKDVVDAVTDFRGYIADHTKMGSRPLPKSLDELKAALAKGYAELEIGLALAYGVLVLMAIVPIYIGSHASNSVEVRDDENIERLGKDEAAMFPVYASCALFGLYLLFKTFGKEYVNLILGGYFFLLGSGSLTVSLRYFVLPFCPASFSQEPFILSLVRKLTGGKAADKADEEEADQGKKKPASDTGADADDEGEKSEEWINVVFDNVDIVCVILAAGVGGWCVQTHSRPHSCRLASLHRHPPFSGCFQPSDNMAAAAQHQRMVLLQPRCVRGFVLAAANNL